MSTYYYSLRIYVPKNTKLESVTKILDIIPTKSIDRLWEYKLIENEGDNHIDFVTIFLNILNEAKIEALKRIGIDIQAISIWLNYEYDSQCNLEISAKDMRKLGDSNLSLCISCWEKYERE